MSVDVINLVFETSW